MRFVAVTACPTGIAHSEMAAESLEQAAKKRGHEITVEVHGASGGEPMPESTVQNADAVIFAVDAGVRDRERFAHLPAVEVRTREAIDKPGQILERAEQAAEQRASQRQPVSVGSGPAAAAEEPDDGQPMQFVAVTACPTGIAHSEMAAESLEQAAKKKGHRITVEVQGASGGDAIARETVDSADAVIFAVDSGVRDRERFANLPAVEVRTREAIDKPAEILERAERAAREGAPRKRPAAGDGEAASPPESHEPQTKGRGAGEEIRRWLMTGVSYMIPFVVAGGILIALAFALGGAVEVTEQNVYEEFSVPALLNEIGGTAFAMLVPILAGFIAYAMADRPGIAPGIVGGLIANEIEAGFLGGIAAGLLAGATVNLLKKLPAPGQLKRLVPVLVYPLVGTFVVGAMMIVVIGEPIAALTRALESWLTGLEGANVILLGLILGMMMAFDMGGPVNKVAYAFGIAALEAGAYAPMAAVMAAGMTPPLAMALSTKIRPSLYNPNERRAGDAGWVMGASFITEGAIPFAAADPIRVIPSLMAGSAVAASLSLVFNATLQAPHGGLFVVGLIGNWPLYLVAILAGTLVSAALVTVLKSVGRTEEETQEVAASA